MFSFCSFNLCFSFCPFFLNSFLLCLFLRSYTQLIFTPERKITPGAISTIITHWNVTIIRIFCSPISNIINELLIYSFVIYSTQQFLITKCSRSSRTKLHLELLFIYNKSNKSQKQFSVIHGRKKTTIFIVIAPYE